MRTVHDWFGSYNADHQNPTNRLIHWICVPAILWSAIAALWVLPVPASIGRPGLWCALLMVGALTFYWRLSRPLVPSCPLLASAPVNIDRQEWGMSTDNSGSRKAVTDPSKEVYLLR